MLEIPDKAMPFHDPKSIAGKPLPIDERTELLVIGAGPAGVAAAMEGKRLGLKVILVDENPVSASTMGDDIPLQFGQRYTGVVRNRTAMLEAIIANDASISEMFDAGVDVRLGTSVWGLYANGPSVRWLVGPVVGLHDGETASMLACERIIVATGRRDMGLAFPGWELPGVLGITAAERLLQRYGALDARNAVLLGTSTEALLTAQTLRATGINIAAIVETATASIGAPTLLQELSGIPLFCGHAVRRAEGDASGVNAVVVAPIGPDGAPIPNKEHRIACDAVLLGVGAVPVIELLDALACRTVYAPERGGYVPLLDERQRTSQPAIYAVGDCAGIWPAKSLNPAIAKAEGERAAADAAASLGVALPPPAANASPLSPEHDIGAYRLAWISANVVEAAGEPYVCQCEEVTAREILEVRPPRYLGWPQDQRNTRALRHMLGEGPPNPDQVKRLTRAGMGICQGRRCREQVAALLALSAGVKLHEIPLASHRAPVRPIPLSVAAETNEPSEMTKHWDTWFGMPPQYVPYWDAPRFYTVAERITDTPPENE